MGMPRPEVDIARSLKTIEWLRAELVAKVADLFKAMVQSGEEAILDALAGIQVVVLVLARRLNVSLSRLDLKVENRIRANIESEHQLEQWYGDFSAILKHLQEGKR